VTFKDLKKRVSFETKQQSRLFERLQNKPFWIWNIHDHKLEDINTNGDCCFNHIIGLPQRDSVDKPLYDYEKIIFDSLVTQTSNKHLWITKAIGLGVSEFMHRTAHVKDGTLDKEVTSHNEVLDAFRLALRPYREKTIDY
jgi:hypothetical protein